MCRFALYLGPRIRLSTLVTEPTHSIIHQSYHSELRSEPLNGDGFGVAWYVPELRAEPAVFRSIKPAWNNRNLQNLAPVSVSGCLLAHVRAATGRAAVNESNCHPFVREQYAFMHNGAIGGFDRLRRRLCRDLSDRAFDAIEGNTDSEHLLALMSDRFNASRQPDPLERLAEGVCATIRDVEAIREEAGIDEGSVLNIAVTDGNCAVVSRHSTHGRAQESLHYGCGHLKVEDGAAEVVESGMGDPAVIVASEPLGPDERWREVPPSHLVLISPDYRVELRPID